MKIKRIIKNNPFKLSHYKKNSTDNGFDNVEHADFKNTSPLKY